MADYVNFNKPYPNGWANNAAGETPITAEILNNNYDAFFTSLNNWAAEIKPVSANATGVLVVENLTLLRVDGTNYKVSEVHANPTIPGGTTPPDLSYIAIDGTNYTIPSGGGSGSVVSWTQIQNTGTKIAEIDINGTSTDVYAPASGGGDTVSWTQITGSGTKIATISINGTATDVYAPNSGGGYTDVTGTLTAGSTSITLSNVAITTNSVIEVFDSLDVPYNSKSVSSGSITLTFDAQQSDMGIIVRVS